MADDFLTLRGRKLRRKQSLFNERSSWDAHWQDIANYQKPRAIRLNKDDANRGGRKDQHVHDNTALFAQRTLAAGLMAGMTSPARPWFRFALRDQDLMEFYPVKQWLHQATTLVLAIFAQSNTYRVMHNMYSELGLFGTASAFMMADFKDVLRLYPMPVGEYAMATNYRGEVDSIVREFNMTVEQVVGQFGEDRVSIAVKNLWDRGTMEALVPVVHLVEPNTDRDTRSPLARNKPYSSVYIETGSDNPDKFLRESGYDEFPALTPRWEVLGNDVYGNSPGMDCLGDVKQLQHEQLRKAQAIDYQVNPPLQVPTGYKEFTQARLPGGVFHIDQTTPTGGVRSAFEVKLDLSHLMQDILDIRERIKSAYYADLFLMLANDTRSNITATEVMERHEEKMLMLGPVLERLHNEMLSPLVVRAFNRCVEAQILPPPPDEIQGMAFEIEYVSTLAQAQKAVGSGAIDQVLMRVGQLAQMNPETVDKVNADNIVDELTDMYGINPKLIRGPEEVAAMREQRAQQQQAAQALAAAESAAGTAKTAGDINTDGLSGIQDMFQGYGT